MYTLGLEHPKYFFEEFLKMSFSSISLNFFHLNIIPMALYIDIVFYFIESIRVYSCNLSILWPPLKIMMPNKFTIANSGHPVSKSWQRPCSPVSTSKHFLHTMMVTLPCCHGDCFPSCKQNCLWLALS